MMVLLIFEIGVEAIDAIAFPTDDKQVYNSQLSSNYACFCVIVPPLVSEVTHGSCYLSRYNVRYCKIQMSSGRC